MVSCLTDEHEAAATIAAAAGRLLVEVRGEGLSGKALGDAGDRRSHEFIMRELAERFPDDAVLSEEGADDQARLGRQRVWIVDPLDGTREFTEPGRRDWAIHVCLVVNGAPVAGAVALPARELTLSTGRSLAPAAATEGLTRILVSRTRPPRFAHALAEQLGGELVPMGSAGAKAMAVLLGDAGIYAHAGGMYEWDAAAPVAVALAAGLHASRIDGSPCVFNRPNPWMPDLLVCRQELAAQVLAALSQMDLSA